MVQTRNRVSSAFAVLCAALFLGGCATSEERHGWLSPDSFATAEAVERRIDELERSLQNRCAFQDERAQAQMISLDILHESVRAVRADVRAQSAAPAAPLRCPPSADRRFDNKEVLGTAEWVGFPSIGTYLKARVDTGASISSLSATEITPFERDGKNWVRFMFALTDDDVVVESVRDKWIEAPVVRHVRIIQASGTERRAVISLPMTLGPIEQSVEFTVTDRTHLSHPVLLGRRFMLDIAVVDISERYIHPRPEFPGGEPAARAAGDETDPDETVEE